MAKFAIFKKSSKESVYFLILVSRISICALTKRNEEKNSPKITMVSRYHEYVCSNRAPKPCRNPIGM